MFLFFFFSFLFLLLFRFIFRLLGPSDVDEGAEHYINQIVAHATPTAMKLSTIQEASVQDIEIQAIRMAKYENKWEKISDQYKPFETELCFAGDILLRGNRTVVPVVLREKILELAHEGHPGITAVA